MSSENIVDQPRFGGSNLSQDALFEFYGNILGLELNTASLFALFSPSPSYSWMQVVVALPPYILFKFALYLMLIYRLFIVFANRYSLE